MMGGCGKKKNRCFPFPVHKRQSLFTQVLPSLFFRGEMYYYKLLTKKEIFFFHISRKSFEKVWGVLSNCQQNCYKNWKNSAIKL